MLQSKQIEVVTEISLFLGWQDYDTRNYLKGSRRFEMLDQAFKKYPYLSPYCHSANNPILFIDGSGMGPIVDALRLSTYPIVALSAVSKYTIEYSVSASASAGLGVFLGAGATGSNGIAIDPQGNFGLVLSAGAFADAFSAFNSKAAASTVTGVGDKGGVKGGNFVSGAQASAQVGVTFHNENSVIKLGGKSLGASGPSIDVSDFVSIGVDVGDKSLGISFGVGVGAAISMLGTDNFIFATTLDDLGKLEDNYNDAKKFAKEESGQFNTVVKQTGENQISVIFNVTTKNKEGEETTKSFEGAMIKIDKQKNAVYTNGVKDEK